MGRHTRTIRHDTWSSGTPLPYLKPAASIEATSAQRWRNAREAKAPASKSAAKPSEPSSACMVTSCAERSNATAWRCRRQQRSSVRPDCSPARRSRRETIKITDSEAWSLYVRQHLMLPSAARSRAHASIWEMQPVAQQQGRVRGQRQPGYARTVTAGANPSLLARRANLRSSKVATLMQAL